MNWKFKDTDRWVDLIRKHQLEPIGYMGSTPPWALPDDAIGKPRCAFRFPPRDECEPQFIEYCKRVATRYRGKIKYYKFWSEPNGCGWVREGCRNADSYAEYTRWLKVWYQAMKKADPDCILGAGSLDYHDGVPRGYEYLEGMYRSGAKGSFDAFCIHPYDKSGGTLHWRAVEDTRRVMVEHGDADKPIWITEFGWRDGDGESKARRLTETLKRLSRPEYAYVTMATYLSLTDPPDEPGWGLCNDDLSPRPAYLAFKSFLSTASTRPTQNN